MMQSYLYQSPVGYLGLVKENDVLIRVYLPNEIEKSGLLEKQQTNFSDYLSSFQPYIDWLDAYFRGEKVTLEGMKLKPTGTLFQLLVYKELEKIPYGKVITYGDLAELISKKNGKKKCPQAIGQAVGKNPIPIFIPCHRVIGMKKQLTGYRGGLKMKEELLHLEKVL